MTWGIDFTTNVFIARSGYEKNKFLVQDAIDECQEDIHKQQIYIQMLGASTPKDITPAEQDPLYYINSEIENAIKEIEELSIKRYKLILYLEYLDKPEEIEQEEEVS